MKKSDLKTGMIVETRGGDRFLVMLNPDCKDRELIEFSGGFMPLERYNDDLILDGFAHELDIMKLYSAGASICYLLGTDITGGKLELKLIWQRPKPILDEAERKYLKAVINPLRNRVDFICKCRYDGVREYIHIEFKGSPYMMMFPTFKRGSMYNGMK